MFARAQVTSQSKSSPNSRATANRHSALLHKACDGHTTGVLMPRERPGSQLKSMNALSYLGSQTRDRLLSVVALNPKYKIHEHAGLSQGLFTTYARVGNNK